MLVDASVARSFAVVGWSHHLLQVCGGTVLTADGVHGAEPDDPSELRRIRTALQRQADQAGFGSGVASRALAAIQLTFRTSHDPNGPPLGRWPTRRCGFQEVGVNR